TESRVMSSIKVRYSRKSWIVDVSRTAAGKRERRIKAFGRGPGAKQAAEEYAVEIAPEVRAGKFWEQGLTVRHLWASYAKAELLVPLLSAGTIADYQSMAENYLLPRWGATLVQDIDAEAVKALRADLLSKPGAKFSGKKGSGKLLAARTAAKILIRAGTVFRHGESVGLATDNPVADVKKPKARRRPVYVMEPGEIAKLRAALDVPWERLLVELAITTGLRSGEIRGLTWDAVDLEGKRLFVER